MRLILIIAVGTLGIVFTQESESIPLRTKSVFTGERLDYRMYLWNFTVGKGSTEVDKELHYKNNHACYKVEAQMQTLGMATWISKVDDHWGAYLDTSELVTHESFRKQREGPSSLDELIVYDHAKDKAYVQIADQKTGKFGNLKVYTTPDKVRDVVSGFMFLRIVDFSKYKLKDTLTVSGFFEDKAYHFKIIYYGLETIETDIGKIPCHKLVPIMPDNQLFRGENSITAWLSADENQVPVKVDAKMFVGHAGTVVTGFRGLHKQLKVLPK